MNKKNQNQQYNLTKTIIVIVVAIIFGILGIEKDNIQNILGDISTSKLKKIIKE